MGTIATRPQIAQGEGIEKFKIEWEDTSGRGKAYMITELFINSKNVSDLDQLPQEPPEKISVKIKNPWAKKKILR